MIRIGSKERPRDLNPNPRGDRCWKIIIQGDLDWLPKVMMMEQGFEECLSIVFIQSDVLSTRCNFS